MKELCLNEEKLNSPRKSAESALLFTDLVPFEVHSSHILDCACPLNNGFNSVFELPSFCTSLSVLDRFDFCVLK